MAQLFHPRLLLRHERPPIHHRLLPPDARERMVRNKVGNVRAPNHDLRGHAADIDACSAEGAGLDHRHRRTFVRGAQRARECRAAAADDCNVQLVAATRGHPVDFERNDAHVTVRA